MRCSSFHRQRARRRQYLCRTGRPGPNNHPTTDVFVPLPPTAGIPCQLCPKQWTSYRDECYRLSTQMGFWTRSQEACAWTRSHLLVIRDHKELGFIQRLTKDEYPMWIGLNITAPGRNWTWVDGSPLNQTFQIFFKKFTVSGPAEENRCAAIRKNRIYSANCTALYQWICQKAAILI
uniref:C-type lectin domain-containing protein n=1 Tax=Pelusios castaneus TaxID=367368 RepID=A0A8C8RJH1_9SAUR